MLFNPRIILLCIHSGVLLAVAASLATKMYTERLLSSYIFSNTALHYSLTTALFGFNVACAFFHVWPLTMMSNGRGKKFPESVCTLR